VDHVHHQRQCYGAYSKYNHCFSIYFAIGRGLRINTELRGRGIATDHGLDTFYEDFTLDERRHAKRFVLDPSGRAHLRPLCCKLRRPLANNILQDLGFYGSRVAITGYVWLNVFSSLRLLVVSSLSAGVREVFRWAECSTNPQLKICKYRRSTLYLLQFTWPGTINIRTMSFSWLI